MLISTAPALATKAGVDEVDAGRADFVRRHFHHEVTDSHHYDLVIDTSRLGIDATVDLVCRALCLRGLAEEAG